MPPPPLKAEPVQEAPAKTPLKAQPVEEIPALSEIPKAAPVEPQIIPRAESIDDE